MKKLVFLLLLLGAALTGLTYWLSLPKSQVNGDDFKFETAVCGDIIETVSATGILFPHETLAVGSELPGKVVQLFPNADFNKEVQEGEPLLQLDDSVARQALEEAHAGVMAAEAGLAAARSLRGQAEAGMEAAKLKEARLGELVRSNIGMRREHDEAVVQLRQADAAISAAQSGIQAALGKVGSAKAALAKAQIGVDLTTVRVPTRRGAEPSAGGARQRYTVIDRKVVLGQLIGPQLPTPLFTLASDLGRMQVHAQVAESDVIKIQRDLEATFTRQSEDEYRFQGKVVQIRPMPANVQGAVFFTVVIDAENARDPNTQEWRLRPGMTAVVDIGLRSHKQVWKVPTKVLSFQLEKDHQSEEGKKKLVDWQGREDADDWKVVWQLDAQNKGYPYFVRIGGQSAAGEAGLKDGQFNEVHEWDPELNPAPDPNQKETWPKFLVDAPPAQKPGLFNFSKQVKVF